MKLENRIKQGISDLEEFIEKTEDENNWKYDVIIFKFKGRKIKLDEYVWHWCGLKEKYEGRLEALKSLVS